MKRLLTHLSQIAIVYLIVFSLALVFLSKKDGKTLPAIKSNPSPAAVILGAQSQTEKTQPKPANAKSSLGSPSPASTKSNQAGSTNGSTQQSTGDTSTAQSQPSQPKDLSADLGNHNSKGDCWMAISGHIYNITPYFGQHPGGDAALSKYCGSDATTAFNTKDKSPPSPHSSSAANMLSQFLIQ